MTAVLAPYSPWYCGPKEVIIAPMELARILGYLSSLLLVSTFYMKTMIPLRITAILANVCVITWALIANEWYILAIQAAVLPLNLMRLFQVHKAIEKVSQANRGELNVDALARFVSQEKAEAGQTLFKAGDPSDKMYIIKSGSIRLEGLGKVLGEGDLLGEIGIIAPDGKRTATATCDTDCEFLTLTQKEVMDLYYVDPGFGWYLIKLVTNRLLANARPAEPAESAEA
ncbi:MAG: cyclic nucleotide-binding domain-containing protein [Deltaproteobacteria bacterium]|jgi:hypothetical protein|nr:cyclic nucleotide-binding domain-containing protein [Deltaproteobacteria bacterium]